MKIKAGDLFYRSIWIYAMTVSMGALLTGIVTAIITGEFLAILAIFFTGMLLGMIVFLPLIILVWLSLLYTYKYAKSRKNRNMHFLIFCTIILIGPLHYGIQYFDFDPSLLVLNICYGIALLFFYFKVNNEYDAKAKLDWEEEDYSNLDDILDVELD